jgi:hypothetical protein
VDLTLGIARMPLWLSGFLFVVIPTLVFMCGPLVVRRFIPIDRIAVNNEVAGFKFATLGVIYAVLLGFAVIVVWERFAEAEGAVSREAGALASMYRLSGGLDPPMRASLYDRLSEYAVSVINEDWPAMSRAAQSSRTREVLTRTYDAVLSHTAESPREAAILAELLNQLDHVTQERRVRIDLASGIVPDLIWIVLLIGAILTLGFTFFFGLENLTAQTVMTGMLSLMIFSALFVAMCIDHPFTGQVRVTPEAFTLVLEDF